MRADKYIPYNFINPTECCDLPQTKVVLKSDGSKGYIKMISDEYDDYWDAYGDPCAIIEFEDGSKEHYTAQELLDMFVDASGNPIGRPLTNEQYALYKQEKSLLDAWFGMYDNGSLEASPSLLKATSSFVGKLLKEAHSALFDKVIDLELMLSLKMSDIDRLTKLLRESNKKNQELEREFNAYKQELNVLVGEDCGQLYAIRSKHCSETCPKCHGTGKRKIVYSDTGEESAVDCPKTVGYIEYWIEPVRDRFTVVVNKTTGNRYFVSKEKTKCVMQKDDDNSNSWLSYQSTSWNDDDWFSKEYFESIESAEAYLRKHVSYFSEEHYLGVIEPTEEDDN